MKYLKGIAVLSVAAGTFLVGAGLGAQPSGSMSRPWRNGSVWEIQQVRVKSGMNEAYLAYLAGQWKTMQEAFKKEGLILSYRVISTEAHGPTDFNLLLMTEYKDLASMEATEDKAEAVAERIVGDEKRQQAGYKERSEIRELIGSRLSREIVLEPRK